MGRIIILLGISFLLIQPTASLAQERKILYSRFQEAGEAATLKGISEWRTAEKESIRKKIKDLSESTKKELADAGDAALKEAWSQILLSDYREFQINGNRVNFEKLYFNRRTKLSLLVAAELATGKGKYLPDIVNGLTLILEESTWVLPAHLTGPIGKLGPDPEKPLLDLFTAETAAHLAWVSLLLEEELSTVSPIIVRRIDSEIQHRIIMPYLSSNDYWWMGFNTARKQNNWNIWINSNLLKIAVLNIREPEQRNVLIKKVIQSADKFLDSYPADGGCDEGPAYWSAAGGALGEFVSLLTRVSSGRLNWKNNSLIHNIGKYIYKVHIDGTRFVNFADAPGTTLPDAGRVYNFGEMFNDPTLKSFASYLVSLNSSSSGMLGPSSIIVFANNVRIMQDLISNPPAAPYLMQNWLPDLEVLNLRQKGGSPKGMTFMAKGGHNGESHNHNDIGNFMLYSDGSPVIIDLGKGTYTRQTFSPDRYKLWYNQSQWHNAPQINGIDQQAGENFKSKQVTYKPGKSREIFSMDISDTYPGPAGVKSWKREFDYNRKAGSLTLREDYELLKDSLPVQLNFIAWKVPVKLGEGRISLSSGSSDGVIEMSFDPTQFIVRIEEKVIDDASLRGVWGNTVHRIVLESRQKGLKGSPQIIFKNTPKQ